MAKTPKGGGFSGKVSEPVQPVLRNQIRCGIGSLENGGSLKRKSGLEEGLGSACYLFRVSVREGCTPSSQLGLKRGLLLTSLIRKPGQAFEGVPMLG